MSVIVCDVRVSCNEKVHVCVCLSISACRVSVISIPVSARKARCAAKWRFLWGVLTFPVCVGVSSCCFGWNRQVSLWSKECECNRLVSVVNIKNIVSNQKINNYTKTNK